MKKFFLISIPILIGVLLIGTSIWLFFLAKNDNTYLLLFGLGTAILIPLGISLIGYGSSYKSREVTNELRNLTKVGKIETLLKEAKSKEEELEIIKKAYSDLEKNLRFNSERMALEIRRERIINHSKEMFTELKNIENKIGKIDNNLKDSKLPLEVQLLRERVMKDKIVIIRGGKNTYKINKDDIPNSFFFPISFKDIFFELLKRIENIQKDKLKKSVTNNAKQKASKSKTNV